MTMQKSHKFKDVFRYSLFVKNWKPITENTLVK